MDNRYFLYRAMMRRQRDMDNDDRYPDKNPIGFDYRRTRNFAPWIEDRQYDRTSMVDRRFDFDGNPETGTDKKRERRTVIYPNFNNAKDDSGGGSDGSYAMRRNMPNKYDDYGMSNYDENEGRYSLTKSEAEQWVRHMENADDTKGGHFSLKEALQIMEEKNIQANPYDFYAALNAMYSDYCKVAHEFGVNNKDFYICMAKAFIRDKDAVPDKVAAYYEYIVS